VVVLLGARQTGKTTLVTKKRMGGSRTYLSMDDLDTLGVARSRPEDLVEMAGPLTFDEVQRAPELLHAIKRSVDRDRRPGRFLLTGSANLLMMRRVSESLAGRAVYIHLLPMTEAEKAGRAEAGPWGRLLACEDESAALDAMKTLPAAPARDLDAQLLVGGYPPSVLASSTEQRIEWFDGYVRTYLERDLREVASITALPDFKRLLKLAALRVGQTVQQTSLGREAALPNYTVHRYLNLMETSMQTVRLPPFLPNRGKRLVKLPKLFWTDTGLAAHLADIHSLKQFGASPMAGALTENIVLTQLLAWRETVLPRPEICFWRTHAGAEVDLVIEFGRRALPIEIKRSTRVKPAELEGMRTFLREHSGRAPFGLVLYGGTEITPILAGVIAVPLSLAL
jgi:predicted AAA+ superfamily ATPase